MIHEWSGLVDRESPINPEDGRSAFDGGTGKGTGSDVYWNPKPNLILTDGVVADPCASLYHELFHSFEDDAGTKVETEYHVSGIATSELKATWAENAYRAAHDLPARTTYAGHDLPPDRVHTLRLRRTGKQPVTAMCMRTR